MLASTQLEPKGQESRLSRKGQFRGSHAAPPAITRVISWYREKIQNTQASSNSSQAGLSPAPIPPFRVPIQLSVLHLL